MIATWVAIAAVLCVNTLAVRDYLDVVGRIGRASSAAASIPRHQAYLVGGVDSQVWVRHAQSLLDGNGPQLRHTDIDNAPYGREVHWNSGWAWTIAAAGWLTHAITGEPIVQALERATLWLSPLVLFVLIVTLSSYAARRGGALAGVCVAIAMNGHAYLFSAFLPSEVDHHGLLATAVFGLVLGIVFGGAGWHAQEGATSTLLPSAPRAAHRAMAISAISGALGMWVSAASLVAPIAIVGVAGAVTAMICAKSAAKAGLRYDPRAWRTWGRVGAISCVVFYVVEYFPSHLGMRLEVNHPAYALAWLGAGELIAELTERHTREVGRRWAQPMRLVWPVALLAVAPVTIVAAGASVFALLDPFLAHLHRSYISEFQPLWNTNLGSLWNPYASTIGPENFPLLVAAIVLAIRRGVAPAAVWFVTIVTAGLTAMEWLQNRWLANASGAQITLALVLLAWALGNATTRLRWVVGLAAFTAMFVPDTVERTAQMIGDARADRVEETDLTPMLYRDIAGAIRATQPAGDVILLASPDESPSIGYYGDFHTVGTFYWENGDGLKAAAAIFSASTADEAKALVRARRITHVALVSGSDFLAPYYQLAHPGAADSAFKRGFGFRLLYGGEIPQWLQAIPYRVQDDLQSLNVHVVLFKVVFDQTVDDALYYAAAAAMANGDLASAAGKLDTLLARNSGDPRALVARARLFVEQRNWQAAGADALAAVQHAPPGDRAQIATGFGNVFAAAQRDSEAVRLYRASVAAAFDPEVACSLAFILSSSSDARVRNGNEAVSLAQRLRFASGKHATIG